MRFASPNNPLRSKLGARIVPLIGAVFQNVAVGTINNSHSILIEWFFNWASRMNQSTVVAHNIHLSNGVSGQVIELEFLNGTSVMQWYQNAAAGWVAIPSTPYPKSKLNYHALLLNRATNTYVLYKEGSIEGNTIVANTPDLSAGVNLFSLGAGIPWNVDVTHILIRLSTLTSVPATIDSAIARMYRCPMTLDMDLQTVGIIMSQYDFEDINLMPPATNIDDHGIHGNLYPLTSSASLADKIRIVEKP